VIRVRSLLLVFLVFAGLDAAELNPETNAAFDRYVKVTEEGFAKSQGFENFLWLDHHSNEKTLVWLGQSVIRPLKTLDHGAEIDVPGGDLQHWLGAVFLDGADIDRVRGLMMNLAGYKDFFRQLISESKVNKKDGDQYDFLLRLYKKQVSTVVLNVDESGKYTLIDPNHWTFASHSTHIGELEHPKNKKKQDQERSPDQAEGYLWRFNFYLRVQQSDNGVWLELEVISLARGPGGRLSASRFLNGFQSYPQDLTESIIDTLQVIFPHHR
jgi:hypothetical protein